MSQTWKTLVRRIEAHAQNVRLGVSAITPNADTWCYCGDTQFPSASAAKIPIMISIYRMLDAGRLSLDTDYVLSDADKANGAGVLRHLSKGLTLRLRDLLYLMIAISDNTATNLLIHTAGMGNINATMRELGMVNSRLSRLMVGRLATEGEQENLATANDYALATHAIVSGEAASQTACEAMMALLSLQQNNRRIGRYVPVDDRYAWGSKNGTNPGITHDVGFVSSPAGTLSLAVLVCDAPDEVTGEAIIADITAAALQDVFPEDPSIARIKLPDYASFAVSK